MSRTLLAKAAIAKGLVISTPGSSGPLPIAAFSAYPVMNSAF
jgi:hypothetical protein